MQWTNFDPTVTKPATAVNHVTLSPRGEFYLNETAMMNLGYPSAVRLMFEEGEKLVGIAAAALNAKASYELRPKYGTDTPARIFRATSFCRHIGMLPDRTIVFRDPKIENGVLILDPANTDTAPQRGRAARAIRSRSPLEDRSQDNPPQEF